MTVLSLRQTYVPILRPEMCQQRKHWKSIVLRQRFIDESS